MSKHKIPVVDGIKSEFSEIMRKIFAMRVERTFSFKIKFKLSI